MSLRGIFADLSIRVVLEWDLDMERSFMEVICAEGMTQDEKIELLEAYFIELCDVSVAKKKTLVERIERFYLSLSSNIDNQCKNEVIDPPGDQNSQLSGLDSDQSIFLSNILDGWLAERNDPDSEEIENYFDEYLNLVSNYISLDDVDIDDIRSHFKAQIAATKARTIKSFESTSPATMAMSENGEIRGSIVNSSKKGEFSKLLFRSEDEFVKKNVMKLCEIFPSYELSFLDFLLLKNQDDIEKVAQILFESDENNEIIDGFRKEYEPQFEARKNDEINRIKQEKRLKRLIVEKYDLKQVAGKDDHSSKSNKKQNKPGLVPIAWTGSDMKVRYRDNEVVSRKGEKFIVEKDPMDDYDGGSRGRIKSKGKRGPGWVAG